MAASTFKFSEIPISVKDNAYGILFAAFIYDKGVWDKDVGHYTVGIRINEKWEISDDTKSKSKEVSANNSAAIEALLYLKR